MVNRPKSKLNDALCVRLHRDEGCSTREIAAAMGCHPPAIYRAFQRQGYAYKARPDIGRPKARELPPPGEIDEKLFPPSAKEGPDYPTSTWAAISARARHIEPREPCFLCGVRGDIGCRHRPAGGPQ